MDDCNTEKITNKIYETVSELKSIENPNSINLDMDPNDKTIIRTYDKIINLPLEKKLILISGLGKNHAELGSNHKFTEMSKRSQKNSILRLKEKVAFLESQKKSIENEEVY